jgi:protein involved in polysaccharide export with SLBB domain
MTLMHDGKETNLVLDSLYQHGANQFNVRMMPGDRLLIPEIRNHAFVFEAVNRPGSYVFKPGDHVMDAVNGSGGPSADADLKKVIVIHIAKGKQAAKVTVINLLKFLKNGDYKFNVLLTAGDGIFVPAKTHTTPDRQDALWGFLSAFSHAQAYVGPFTGHFGD